MPTKKQRRPAEKLPQKRTAAERHTATEPKGRSPASKRTPQATGTVYQFKITLLGVKPPIWRRIQTEDCTLGTLHHLIQRAMGWTNSHLFDFEIRGERYGDPDFLDGDLGGCFELDSTRTRLRNILPKNGKRFAFRYLYDFGDSWEHEILFEGSRPVDPHANYPRCVKGARACPPEDCGGVWGYADFLQAIRDPEHEEHESMLEWIGGSFNAEAFDATRATEAM